MDNAYEIVRDATTGRQYVLVTDRETGRVLFRGPPRVTWHVALKAAVEGVAAIMAGIAAAGMAKAMDRADGDIGLAIVDDVCQFARDVERAIYGERQQPRTRTANGPSRAKAGRAATPAGRKRR